MSAPTVADPRTRSGAPNPNGRLRTVPLHRRWNVPWILLGVLLVAGSALAFTVLGGGAAKGTPALALATGVAAGETLTEDHLTTLDVDVPGSVRLVPAGRLEEMVGRTAVVDLPAGTLVTEDLFAGSSVLRDGEALVGIRLDPSALPIAGLRSGDPVMVVRTPGASGTGDPADGSAPLVWTGTVFAVAHTSGPTGDLTVVTLKVDPLDAPAIAAAAAADQVRLVLVHSLDDVPPELLFSGVVGDGVVGDGVVGDGGSAPGPAGP